MATATLTFNQYQQAPTLDADGKPWVQRCFVCDKTVNYQKDAKVSFIRVGDLVRHARCYPPPIR